MSGVKGFNFKCLRCKARRPERRCGCGGRCERVVYAPPHTADEIANVMREVAERMIALERLIDVGAMNPHLRAVGAQLKRTGEELRDTADAVEAERGAI